MRVEYTNKRSVSIITYELTKVYFLYYSFRIFPPTLPSKKSIPENNRKRKIMQGTRHLNNNNTYIKYVYVRMHVYARMRVRVRVRVCACVHMCVCMRVCAGARVHICTYVRVCACARARAHV